MESNIHHPPNSFEQYSLDPIYLAHVFSHDWRSTDPQIINMEPPFKLRSENPDVRHVLINQEYIVVRGEDPYQPSEIWDTKLQQYKLHKEAQNEDIHVFQVPSDVVTLSAILNDAVDGDPDLFVNIFGEIGSMFGDIAVAFDDEHQRPITSAVTIDDIAFVKGRKEPFLLPPFSLDLDATGESPAASIEADLRKAPLNPVQAKLVEDALSAFEDSYASHIS